MSHAKTEFIRIITQKYDLFCEYS